MVNDLRLMTNDLKNGSMKKYHYLFFAISLLVLLFPGCRNEHSSSPLKFKAWENNPILGPGKPGEWDKLGINTPDIVWYDSVFYLFYTGSKLAGNMAVGLAVSTDGRQFTKFGGNPVLAPRNKGFDAYSVGATRVVRDDSVWTMYYNAMEIAGFSPGPSIGRAEAVNITGPWARFEMPVLTAGKKGEWDAGFVIPCAVIVLDDGSYIMYYSGGKEYSTLKNFYIGMAISSDGIKWKKYNDPATNDHPFADSDPVLMNGKGNEWDNGVVWLADVKKFAQGFSMYYTGIKVINDELIFGIGYATSKDGIHWDKYRENPVYKAMDDPYTMTPDATGSVENPSMLFLDNLCFMYYDYTTETEKIGMAIAVVK
jgi:predicted GH43/DUF377 family glycosyl hydrolase